MTRAALLALALLACSGHPSARRAVVVGLGALGTGAAVAAQACAAHGSQACRETSITAAVAVLGTALAAGATAYLDAAEPASAPWRSDVLAP